MSTTKSLQEWLNELPDKERNKAFKNADPARLTASYTSMYMAICHAFEWPANEFEYWRKVADRYK